MNNNITEYKSLSDFIKKDNVITIKTVNNKKQLFIPRGFAHGFVVLSDSAIFAYKVDNYYNKESESGINYNDPTLEIKWMLNNSQIIANDKDLKYPEFN